MRETMKMKRDLNIGVVAVVTVMLIIIATVVIGEFNKYDLETIKATSRPSGITVAGWCEILTPGLPIYNNNLWIEELPVKLPNGTRVKALVLPNKNLEFRGHKAFVVRTDPGSGFSDGNYIVIPPPESVSRIKP